MIKILSTTISTVVQKSAGNKGNTGWFSIGKLSRDALEVQDNDEVLLTIKTPAGSILFNGIKELISGEEIYDKKNVTDLSLLRSGQEIIVTIEKIE